MTGRRAAIIPAIAVLACLAASAPAVQFRTEERYALRAGETLSEELWLAAQDAQVDGVVADDLFVLTQSARLAGSFQNDLWAAAERDITLSGRVRDHARVMAGQTVTIEGSVGSTLMGAARTLRIARGAVVEGDAWLGGGAVALEGHVRGDAWIAAQQVTLGGRLGKSVRVVAKDIVVLPGTEIEGDLVYTSGKELFLDKSVVLRGQLVRKEPEPATPAARARSGTASLLSQAFFYVSALVAGAAWMGLFPRTSGRAVRLLRQSGWRCALAGLVAFCLMPMLALALLATVVGIPLSLLILLAFVLMLYLSKIVVGLVIGALVMRRRGRQSFGTALAALTIGLAVIYMLPLLPVVNAVAWFLTTALGMGALVLALIGGEIEGATPPAPPPLSEGAQCTESVAGDREGKEGSP